MKLAAPPRLERPVFIIAAPRSGSNLLFEQLLRMPGVWSLGRESHEIFDGVLQHDFLNPRFDSIRATAADATPERTREIVHRFSLHIRSAGARYRDLAPEERPPWVRLVDKLPKNSFRVPFLNASFPDARFVFLWREPRGNIGSLIEGWLRGARTGRFVTYRHPPGTERDHWCFVLPPGWRDVADDSIPEIAAFQWRTANETALGDLMAIPNDRWCAVSYADLVDRTEDEVRRLCAFADLEFDPRALALQDGKPRMSRTALGPPRTDKWKKHAAEVEAVLPSVQGVAERMDALLGRGPRGGLRTDSGGTDAHP